MDDKVTVYKKKSILKEYGLNLLKDKKKLISERSLKKFKKGKFYKVDEKHYIKLPLFTKKVRNIIAASMAGVLVAGTAATVAILYVPRKVNLKSDYLEISKSNKACLGYDYKCTFKIKDNVIEDNYMKLIKINSVKSNGKEIPVDGYSFIYQTNAKNEFTINKKYCKGNIEIDVTLEENKQNKNCFFFEYDIDAYAPFKSVKVEYPIKEKQTNDVLTGIDWTRTESMDDIYLKSEYDIGIFNKDDLSALGLKYNLLIVREDNRLKLSFESDNILPEDIWFRSNARFTKKDEDYTLTYSNDKKSATLEVPYFFIRDNGSIRRK